MNLRVVNGATMLLVGAIVCAQAEQPIGTLRRTLVAVDDRRAALPGDLEALTAGLQNPASEIQVVAVRALGRLEQPTLAGTIAPALGASEPTVRAEAADALAQSASSQSATSADVSSARQRLIERLDVETSPRVLRVLLESVGRLRYTSPEEIIPAEQRLRTALDRGPAGSIERRLGAARGLESLTRRTDKTGPISQETGAVLRRTVERQEPATSQTGLARRLALSALLNGGMSDRATLDAATRDPDMQVRQIAAAATGRLDALDDRVPMIDRGLHDSSPIVRFEALRAYGRRLQGDDCRPVLSAISDPDPHVVLLALDLLRQPCGDRRAAQDILARSANSDEWHRAAHAYVSLARQFPGAASALLGRFATNPVWQVRMYAAHAAEALNDAERLRQLTTDGNDNVCQAALESLQKLQKHDADEVFLRALARPDYQVILTAANALEGSPQRTQSVSALLTTLERVTREHRDTSRDPRVAVLKRIQELGGADRAAALQPYLRDFDPEVASITATILTAWTGNAVEAQPPSRPASTDLSALEFTGNGSVKVTVSMRDQGTFDLALFAGEAPVTVSRFIRLARAGYYNGLTFHRVVPNFVLQGGSPGANEYMGDGEYLRDEVGVRSHLRGTLGVSTRGRDTGDAQIFVNLVDNPRLDHIYTVFAEVTRGMDIVDRILEGDVIDRIDIVSVPPAKRAGSSRAARTPAS